MIVDDPVIALQERIRKLIPVVGRKRLLDELLTPFNFGQFADSLRSRPEKKESFFKKLELLESEIKKED